ncbi:MAG: hypothetical protein K6E59_04680 [Bacilli bacterium]|nr:hypothetical protein [Bacilli bacterium]
MGKRNYFFLTTAAFLACSCAPTGTGENPNGQLFFENPSITIGLGETREIAPTSAPSGRDVQLQLTEGKTNASLTGATLKGEKIGASQVVARCGGKTAKLTVNVVEPTPANGTYDFRHYWTHARSAAAETLERFAANHYLTGVPLYEKATAGYVDESYHSLSDADINPLTDNVIAPLSGEDRPAYQRYAHYGLYGGEELPKYPNANKNLYLTPLQSPLFFRYQDEEGANHWKGYASRSDLPIAEALDEEGLSKVYLVPVKTGADLTYATSSALRSSFNKRQVVLDDYLFAAKTIFATSSGFYPTNSSLYSSSLVEGLNDYGVSSKDMPNDALWEKVGIKGEKRSDGDYLKFTFTQKLNPEEAAYYLSDPFLAPIPEDFFRAICDDANLVNVGQVFGRNESSSFADYYLTASPYYVQECSPNEMILGKGDNTLEGFFQIPGFVLTAAPDPLPLFNAGKLSAIYHGDKSALTHGVKLSKERGCPCALNLNTCTQGRWNQSFGENGAVAKNDKDHYWNTKPIMSNASFLEGLFACIDRTTLAKTSGGTPSLDPLLSSFDVLAAQGLPYQKSAGHKAIIGQKKAQYGETGFDLAKAKVLFAKAAEELLPNDRVGKDIHLSIYFHERGLEEVVASVKKMIEDAFNEAQNHFTLAIDASYLQTGEGALVTEETLRGRYDIHFGQLSPSGTLWNHFDLLCDDNHAGFTMNYGYPTSDLCEEILFDGHYWSFNALVSALEGKTFVVDGVKAEKPTA